MHYSLNWVFIMRNNRIGNLAVKMTTQSLSMRYGILYPLVLITVLGFFFSNKYDKQARV